MQGSSDPNRELLDATAFCRHLVEKGSVADFLTDQHTWEPQLNSLKPSSISATEGFIGDYYGNITGGSTDYTTSVSTFDDGTNPNHFQQQVVATLTVP